LTIKIEKIAAFFTSNKEKQLILCDLLFSAIVMMLYLIFMGFACIIEKVVYGKLAPSSLERNVFFIVKLILGAGTLVQLLKPFLIICVRGLSELRKEMGKSIWVLA